ncbi:P-loop containing nucleoside triphosphate hydrolase protein [Trametes polyzona]|nr:P-loop containing nucleoside triphosphate hydrolase protein [Trametes polyzona]
MPHPLASLLFNAAAFTESFPAYISPSPASIPRKNAGSVRSAKRIRHSNDSYARWLESRKEPQRPSELLPPGGHRPITTRNIALAYELVERCALDILHQLWQLHPYRVSLMVGLDLVRGAFPALRGYSHAVIVDQMQKSMLSGNFVVSQLLRHAVIELMRMTCETTLDSLAASNEQIVHASARFLVEHAQLEYRIRPDVPTLSDPVVRDLLQEADIFVRSFSGFSSFGLFSPLDLTRIITLVSELLTHLWILSTLTFGSTPTSVILLSVALSVIPSLLSWSGKAHQSWDIHSSQQEARLAAKQEAMRHLAHNESYRPEIMLFGLGPWILRSWARARKALLTLESRYAGGCERGLPSRLLSQLQLSGAFSAFEHLPVLLVLNSSATSLGAFTLYRNTLRSLFLSAGTLLQTLRMAFQGVFLMGAFSAATKLQPRLEPDPDRAVPYPSSEGKGVAIEVKNVSFTYPGSKLPSLRGVTLSISAGETVAIVGCNGSGKTTLAKVLLRILDFDEGGELRVNGADVRTLRPQEYHARATAVLQGFSKFSTSVKGNVGVGYVPDMHDAGAVGAALDLAGAGDLVRSLPEGVKTTLDGDVSYHVGCEGFGASSRKPHGLSGGEWQRIAISRAFMRAKRPEVELLVFDEPTSSLDAHAQKQFFDTVERISRDADGNRTKTVVFITHRLSTARRADKIAMMDNGTITEFGSHEQLLARNGRYAALYRASV